MTPALIWLLVGLAFLALEAFGISGVGFLFAGLGAIATGILTQLAVFGTETWLGQGAWFFFLTVAWAALLWKKMKTFQLGRGGNQHYHNMVGDRVTVGAEGLAPGSTGAVTWSGTVMRAELAPGEAAAPAGASLIIREVRGNVLVVAKA